MKVSPLLAPVLYFIIQIFLILFRWTARISSSDFLELPLKCLYSLTATTTTTIAGTTKQGPFSREAPSFSSHFRTSFRTSYISFTSWQITLKIRLSSYISVTFSVLQMDISQDVSLRNFIRISPLLPSPLSVCSANCIHWRNNIKWPT